MTTDALISTWAWIYTVGLAAFAVLVIAIIPLGARDLAALFKSLGTGDKKPESK